MVWFWIPSWFLVPGRHSGVYLARSLTEKNLNKLPLLFRLLLPLVVSVCVDFGFFH